MTIEGRMNRLMEQLADDQKEKLTVTFADGHRERLDGGACVDLVKNSAEKIGRFEGGDGRLAELLNGLLEV